MRVVVRNILLIALACVCVEGCKRKEPETSDPGATSGEVRVAIGDRLGWTQQAADSTELASYQFALYVDGARTTLTGVNCASSGSAFECSVILPALTPGTHTLELASFVTDDSRIAESARSAALRVIAGSATSSFSVSSLLVVTAEQVRLNLAPVAEGFESPSDIAFARDGSVFVAERGGAVRLIRDGALVETPALDLSSEIERAEGGILAIALDPAFAENGLMYALYAVDAPRNGLEFTVARFRYLDGVFAQRAVLLDRTRASIISPSGALRIGPDGKLYVAFDSAADSRIAGSFASYNGKVLRFNTDATTPNDQPASNPIYSLEHPQPLAIDWQSESDTMWVVDRVGTDAGRLSAVVSGGGQSRAAFRTSYALPAGTGPTSATFYRGGLMPIFKGNLFIAAETGRQLVRLRFDPDNASKIVSVERLLTDQIGGVRVVSEAPDGSLYIATDSVLYRLAP
ncbi:MAG TPA: PQQ-dependent sugar dehydrogenase [Vicinamibacterales bacterium]|nr:PQQ-dependent sugar dehydrogenase [Vicinamibacterales bacterium]